MDTKMFYFLGHCKGVVNIMCSPVISLLARKARPDQCFESNQKKFIYSFPKAVCSNLMNNRPILKSIIILDQLNMYNNCH